VGIHQPLPTQLVSGRRRADLSEEGQVVGATDRNWNSATTLYIARRLQELAGDRPIAVLDVGCGAGEVLGQLLEYQYDLYGYDLVEYEGQYSRARRERLLPHFGELYTSHIKVTDSQRDIPFADNSFDVVYANQVFEHVRFLDRMLSECSRVLRPGGTLLANFPLATYPIEGHLRVPFAHWLPPGSLRIKYLQLSCRLGVLARQKGRTTLATAVAQDRYLREETFYRFLNEINAVSTYYFETCEIETEAFVRAKIDLLRANGRGTRPKVAAVMEFLDGKGRLSTCVTHLINAAFCMTNPRKA
jgi:SAM-dependent methyltransferase